MHLLSVGVSAVVFLISWFCLAPSPQTGDGAEQVIVALQGGVLHPPGFVLQAWLNRLVMAIPYGTPAFRLSSLSLIAHSAAVWAVVECARKLGASGLSCVVVGLAFAFYPPTWALGLQPEVFALAHFLMALMLLQAISLSRKERVTKGDVWRIGALAGLGALQHPIVVIAAPAIVYSGYLSLRRCDPKSRVRRGIALFSTALCVSIVGYATLPLLRSATVWPDWGNLRDFESIVAHVFRREYGTLSLAAKGGDRSGLGSWLSAMQSPWVAFPILALLGMVKAMRMKGQSMRNPLYMALGGVCALAVLLLWRARIDGPAELSQSVLERFHGPLVLGMTSFVALALIGSRLAQAIAWVSIVATAVYAHPRIDFSKNRTLDVFREAMGATLPEEVLYVGTSDVEAPYGILTPRGPRFPIASELLVLPWYRERTLPMIEPRALPVTDVRSLVQDAFERGYPIAAIDGGLLSGFGVEPELQGLFYILSRRHGDSFTPMTAEKAAQLCSYIPRLTPLPKQGHAVSHAIVEVFQRAYVGAKNFFVLRKEPELATIAHRLSEGLGTDRVAADCVEYVALWQARKNFFR